MRTSLLLCILLAACPCMDGDTSTGGECIDAIVIPPKPCAPEPCVPGEDSCPLGKVCLSTSADNVEGLCTQGCSLTVWHIGEGYDAPCMTGEGLCPNTCAQIPGASCHVAPLLPDDVGACADPAGSPVCSDLGDT